MKRILFSLALISASFSACADLPLDQIDFNKPYKDCLVDYLYDRIDGLDDLIAEIEHKTEKYDQVSIYNIGYYFGKRRALYEVIDHIQGKTTLDSLELPK